MQQRSHRHTDADPLAPLRGIGVGMSQTATVILVVCRPSKKTQFAVVCS